MKEILIGLGIPFLLISALVSLALWAAVAGTNASERQECREWQEQAAKYEGFYLVKWQAYQCEVQGIDVRAVVK